MARSCVHCSAEYPVDADGCPSCGAKVESLDPEFLTESRPSLAEELLERIRSVTHGEFEVLREIGHGGMARVYLAHEVVLDRQLALKVLSPLFGEYPEIVRRFQHEARTAGQLSHPNIVPVFAVYQREGLSFFSMPYVPGISLRKLVREHGALGIEEAIGYIIQAAAGLAYAHDNGVVHRDVKPENMLLEEPHGRLVLTDFGLAKALGGEALTVPGDMIGTPHYMSPEQCEGRSEVDGRSDQYSLALVAYELITGSHPFGELGFRQLMMKQLNEDPPPLDEKRPDVPSTIATAIRRALSKDLTRRFPSIYSFAGALTGAQMPIRLAATTTPGNGTVVHEGDASEAHTLWMREQLKRSHRRRHSMVKLARFGRNGLRKLHHLRYKFVPNAGTGRDLLTKIVLAFLIVTLGAIGIASRGDTESPERDGSPGTIAASFTEIALHDQAGPLVGAGLQLGPPVSVDESSDAAAAESRSSGPEPRAERAADAPDRRRSSAGDRNTAASPEPLAGPKLAASRETVGGDGEAEEAEVTPPRATPRAGPGPREALTATLEAYRLAFEREDLEALSAELYGGEIPRNDLRILQPIFDNADALTLELVPLEEELEGDRARLVVEHRMRFVQTRDKRERVFDLKLRLTFERVPGGWRLVELRK